MKKVIFVLAMLMSYGLTFAEPTYFESHGDADHAHLNACAIMPLTITNIYQPPVPLPAVIAGWTRLFNPGTPTGMPGLDHSNGSFDNGSSGNFGWVFKLTKQAGYATLIPTADPYRVQLTCTVIDPVSQVNLESKWFFYERDYVTPTQTKTTILGEDFNVPWFSDESEALMALYLTKIDASHRTTPGIVTFRVNISGYYSAI